MSGAGRIGKLHVSSAILFVFALKKCLVFSVSDKIN